MNKAQYLILPLKTHTLNAFSSSSNNHNNSPTKVLHLPPPPIGHLLRTQPLIANPPVIVVTTSAIAQRRIVAMSRDVIEDVVHGEGINIQHGVVQQVLHRPLHHHRQPPQQLPVVMVPAVPMTVTHQHRQVNRIYHIRDFRTSL